MVEVFILYLDNVSDFILELRSFSLTVFSTFFFWKQVHTSNQSTNHLLHSLKFHNMIRRRDNWLIKKINWLTLIHEILSWTSVSSSSPCCSISVYCWHLMVEKLHHHHAQDSIWIPKKCCSNFDLNSLPLSHPLHYLSLEQQFTVMSLVPPPHPAPENRLSLIIYTCDEGTHLLPVLFLRILYCVGLIHCKPVVWDYSYSEDPPFYKNSAHHDFLLKIL